MCINNFSPFENLYLPLEVVNFEIWVVKATVRIFLLSSIFPTIECMH